MRWLLQLFIQVLFFTSAYANENKELTLASPDGNIIFTFNLGTRGAVYAVSFKHKTLISESPLSLVFDNGEFGPNLSTKKPVFSERTEDYRLFVGKSKDVHSHYRELIIPLEETKLPRRKINLIVRAFNDGLAFRYEFPRQDDWQSYTLLEENTRFKFQGNPVVHTLFLPSFTTSHEGTYSTLPLNDVREDTLMDVPTLFEFPGKIYVAVTEAALVNYAGMYLQKEQGILGTKLSPLPGQVNVKVKAVLPHRSPWRVLMISDRVGALIESDILTNLNDPQKINDITWLKPGKTTFPWWNGNIVPDTINAPGNNFVTNKYYIDFCARNNLEYHSVVEYGLHEWYTNDGINFQPGPHADVTRPVPGLDMKEICDYAKKQGVRVRVWVHWAALYPKLDSAFAIFERWGLSGMMIDYMDRDDQEMVNIQEEILQKAAAHHLHIQFHGAYKPTGLHRTYPNEFTREGTLNYETNKWNNPALSPDHDITMPFTRMLAGATDYHLGGFRAVTPNEYRTQYSRPLMAGTRCHMLAMYVVLESYLGMVCDYPEAYEGQPGFEFITRIPTTWDQTKVLDAVVNEYITIARKKNNEWYIGTITNHTGRELRIPLNFLDKGTWLAESYTDADDVVENPNHLTQRMLTVTASDVLKINVAAGGGQVIHLRRQ